MTSYKMLGILSISPSFSSSNSLLQSIQYSRRFEVARSIKMATSVLDTPLTIEEFHSFHGIDRRLYSRIVNGLRWDPALSMQIMAVWLWSEHLGYPNIILKLLCLTDGVLNAVIDEALAVLRCLSFDEPPPLMQSEMPYTQELTEGHHISLRVFHQIRAEAMAGIVIKVNDICIRAFEDIAKQAAANAEMARAAVAPVARYQHGPIAQPVLPAIPVPFYGGQGSVYPFPPTFVGGLTPSPQMERGESSGSSSLNLGGSLTPTDEVPAEDRTMFLTFSRGYPITVEEVNSFFTKRFGNCIERIIMQEVPSYTQPLFARLIFYSASKINEVLNGREERVKFNIYGKHVWARQYVLQSK